MSDTSSERTVVARLAADESQARRILAALEECFDPFETAVSAFETASGWNVTIHFRIPPNETAVRALVALAAGAAAANALTFETVAAADWVKASLAGLTPVAAGRFVIHGAHDRARIPQNRIGIEIEAGLAFGTGHHGSTRGCLIALDWIAKTRRSNKILDVGTGSGVLAIAAARALRRPVLASDIDPLAVQIARANARRNRAGAWIEAIHAAGVGGQRIRRAAPYDLILANILLEPLVRLAAPIAKLAAPGGHVVLAGLLRTQATPALAAYRAQGLAIERRVNLGDWTTLVLRRPVRRLSRLQEGGSSDEWDIAAPRRRP